MYLCTMGLFIVAIGDVEPSVDHTTENAVYQSIVHVKPAAHLIIETNESH